MSRIRIGFFTDVHGSTLVFRKGLSLATEFGVDLIIVGGDLSGKRMLEIVKRDDGNFVAYEPYKKKDDSGKASITYEERYVKASELRAFCRKLEAKGYYWFIGDREEIEELKQDRAKRLVVENAAITERLLHWATLVNERLPVDVGCIWTGGNDDEQSLLDSLKSHDLGRFVCGEGRIQEYEEYLILSLGVSNVTPFDTPREVKEEDIASMLEAMASGVDNTDKLVLNVHVPPLNCGDLDLVVDVEEPHSLIHIGSTAVRAFILERQPLADFAGHVHERKGATKIGRTMVFNPGSDYNSGVLQALIVEMEGSAIRNYLHLIK